MFKTSDGQTHNKHWYLNVYLYSEHWKIIRGAKLSASPTCERCGTDYKLQVHHVNYRKIYDVRLDDLMTLCEPCHNQEHRDLRFAKTGTLSKSQIRKEKRRIKRFVKVFNGHNSNNKPKYKPLPFGGSNAWKAVVGIRLKKLPNEQELIEQTRINSTNHKVIYHSQKKNPTNNKPPEERYNKHARDLFRQYEPIQ